jgi:hypothetical protein
MSEQSEKFPDLVKVLNAQLPSGIKFDKAYFEWMKLAWIEMFHSLHEPPFKEFCKCLGIEETHDD